MIELLLYIVFFTFLLVTVMAVMYQNIDGAGRISERIQIQQEGNFLLRKISWAMTGATDVDVNSPTKLTITKSAGNTVFELVPDPSDPTKGNINMIESLVGSELNSKNVVVSDLLFEAITGSPEGVKVSFKLSTGNGVVKDEEFSITKYLRE